MSITSLGGRAYRHRHLFILFWLAVLCASAYFAPKLAGVTVGGGFDSPGSESARAADILQHEFGIGYRRMVQVIYHDPETGVDSQTFRDAVAASSSRIEAVEGVAGVVTYFDTGFEDLVSPDRLATYAIVAFSEDEARIKSLVPLIREAAADNGGLEVHVLGGPAFDYDLEQTSKSDLWQAEKFALPAIVIILILVFGSLVAAGLPALLGAVSVTVALALLYFIGLRAGLSVFILNMVIMVGMGLGVDYSLFVVSRFREELARGGGAWGAVSCTLATAGRAVLFSGAAVIVGMAMLVPFDFVFMRSLGIGGIVVAAISVLVALTLLPAILGVLRQRVNTARVIPVRGLRGGSGRFWIYWSRQVMRRPALFLCLSVAVLAALAMPTLWMKAGSPGAQDLSQQADSRAGLFLFADKWGVGEASPIYVVIDAGAENTALSREFRQTIRELDTRLTADPRVSHVQSLADIDLATETGALGEMMLADPVGAARIAAVVNISTGGDISLVRVVTRTEPTRQETRRLVEHIRDGIVPGVGGLATTEVFVGGSAAEAVDFTARLSSAFPYLVAAVLAITYFVLMLMFRSVVLPLKAIFMNLLSVSAAYGVLVLVFQEGVGAGLLDFSPAEGIVPFVPVILFSILFGLSMDYEVFLLSRIKEEYDRSGDNDVAVTIGLQRTGRIITTAALIMIAVFASFTLAESIIIKEFGVGLAVAILLDATIVRVVIVPATMKLVGKWNWWMPAWLDRALPDLSLRDASGIEPETR